MLVYLVTVFSNYGLYIKTHAILGNRTFDEDLKLSVLLIESTHAHEALSGLNDAQGV